MQKLLFAMCLVVAIAGCLSDEAPTDTGAGGTGSEEEAVADRIGVVFHTGDYEALPDAPATFEVEVPEGAVNVSFEISTVSAQQASQVTVTLDGCGSRSLDWGPEGSGNIAVQLVYSSRAGDLCAGAEGGPQTLSIEAGLAPLQGTVTIRADVPS